MTDHTHSTDCDLDEDCTCAHGYTEGCPDCDTSSPIAHYDRPNSYYRPLRPPYEVWQDGRRFGSYSALKDASTCANDLATDYPYSNVEVRREGRILFHGVARYRPATDEQIERSFDAYR